MERLIKQARNEGYKAGIKAGYKQGVKDANKFGQDDRKAGITEVVEWVNSNLVTIAVEIPASLAEGKSLIEVGRDIMHLQTNGYKSAEKWQVKLKEWEIEKVAAAERTSTEKQIFAVLKDQADICMRVCPCWDKQGNFCFATLPSECTKLNNILALIER